VAIQLKNSTTIWFRDHKRPELANQDWIASALPRNDSAVVFARQPVVAIQFKSMA
jgi:hypothetical protein